MNSVGDRLSTFTEADVFLSELSMVTAGYHVNAAALLDSTVGSRPRGGTGTVRWWALLELNNNWALENWDAIVRFICEAVDNNVCKAISLKLKNMLGQSDARTIKVQLAGRKDIADCLAAVTYKAESDRADVMLDMYELWTDTMAAFKEPKWEALTSAVATRPGIQQLDAMIDYIKEKKREAQHYADNVVNAVLPLPLFEAAYFCKPAVIKDADTVKVDAALRLSKVFSAEWWAALMAELPRYKQEAAAPSDLTTLPWWISRRRALPEWYAAVRRLVTIKPTSAASERLFSMVKNLFPDVRNRASDKLVETTIRLRLRALE